MKERSGALGLGALTLLLMLGCSGDDETVIAGGGGHSSGAGGGSGRGGAGGGSAGVSGASGGSDASVAGGVGGMAGAGNGGGAGGGPPCHNSQGQLFTTDASWNTIIGQGNVASDSDAIIAYLSANHDTDARFQVDFSFTVLEADESTPKESFTPSEDFYEPDCDPAPVPIVSGGAIEGEEGYSCESDGDCHLIVLAKHECRLYEMWRADRRDDQFRGGCLAVWAIDTAEDFGRGNFCTSADAAGLPIAPMLFSADEIAAGEINHAIRFILPNEHIRELMFVLPATHSTRATGGPNDAPPYGARLRLKDEADLSELNPAAMIVARALQEHGMFLADAGNLTFTAKSDRYDAHTWEEVGFGPHDLKSLEWSDFEVASSGTPIDWDSGSCERSAITE